MSNQSMSYELVVPSDAAVKILEYIYVYCPLAEFDIHRNHSCFGTESSWVHAMTRDPFLNGSRVIADECSAMTRDPFKNGSRVIACNHEDSVFQHSMKEHLNLERIIMKHPSATTFFMYIHRRNQWASRVMARDCHHPKAAQLCYRHPIDLTHEMKLYSTILHLKQLTKIMSFTDFACNAIVHRVLRGHVHGTSPRIAQPNWHPCITATDRVSTVMSFYFLTSSSRFSQCV
jgi:hypothetical protein